MPKLTVVQDQSRTEILFHGTPNAGVLLAQHGFGVQQPCGGRGVCGKCAVQAFGDVSAQTTAEKKAGTRLACQITLLGDCELRLAAKHEGISIQTDGSSQTSPDAERSPMPGRYGAAVDVGTTTVALKLLELRTGRCLSSQAALNPQTQIAADVIGRISAAMNGSSSLLRESICGCVRTLLAEACNEAQISPADAPSMVLTGNTTMLYLLTGRNPEPLSHAPFHADTLFGNEERLLGKAVYLPPCMDAFVGADITCAVLAAGMCDHAETALLMDIGTNGEVALWHEGNLYVASTAAGPAFESAEIACGCGSVAGAIDKAWQEDSHVELHTIGDAPAVGLCGSGLIDVIAALLSLGEIDATGAMETDKVMLQNGVYLAAKDVRSVQLAKGAISAGVETMLKTVGLSAAGVNRLYIAGGFGSHINLASAAAIGLIPRKLSQRVEVLGNASLTGAEMLLLNQSFREQGKSIATHAIPVLLGGNAMFSEQFMERMLFETND